MHTRHCAIGVCTYRRPEQLARCLQSLAAIDRPDALELCIIVTDNDPAGSAGPVVEHFRASAPCPVYYRIEKRPGIPCARNNVLSHARDLGITDLAFIDDDEWVDPRWLIVLWEKYAESGADVVAGYVEIVYPPETPRWITENGFFRNTQRSGDRLLRTAATNNVLFDFQKLAVQWDLSFDESFGMAGGSDTDFFYRAAARGAAIAWVEDPLVHELLARERMSLSYLLKSRFRKSNLKPGYADLTKHEKIQLLSGLLRKFAGNLLLAPLSIFRGPGSAAALLNSTVAVVANIMALLGWRIRWDEYKGSSERDAGKINS